MNSIFALKSESRIHFLTGGLAYSLTPQTKTCECGVEIVSRIGFYGVGTLDKHKETEKHGSLLDLKARDPDWHWTRKLNKSSATVG